MIPRRRPPTNPERDPSRLKGIHRVRTKKKSGARTRGTLETVSGLSSVKFTRATDGTIAWEHDGQVAEVFWEAAETRTNERRRAGALPDEHDTDAHARRAAPVDQARSGVEQLADQLRGAFGLLGRGVRIAGMLHRKASAVPGQRPRPDHRLATELRSGGGAAPRRIAPS